MNNINISEIFISLQGEGKYVGARQLFIRFSGCDINCKGCDTDYSLKNNFYFIDEEYKNPISADFLVNKINNKDILKGIHSISFTGGEPLLWSEAIEFIIASIGNKTKYFLETSGYHLDMLKKIYDKLDIVSLDIKLKSTFGIDDNIDNLKRAEFIENNKSYFKLVISDKIKSEELVKVIKLLKEKDFNEVYLHSKNNLVEFKLLSDIMEMFYNSGIICYYVPQMHKMVGIK
ncbi:7-carboxy-7-deazaguanine synthase QueE [Deferribacteraceae bacterium V6Fe1]|nr:7-carboxy-7-deazaguanine synthase QueE [Deferribacteraceae bacterium V6Fe1]